MKIIYETAALCKNIKIEIIYKILHSRKVGFEFITNNLIPDNK